MMHKEPAEKELGDYQTPLYFTDIICEYLKNDLFCSANLIPDCLGDGQNNL